MRCPRPVVPAKAAGLRRAAAALALLPLAGCGGGSGPMGLDFLSFSLWINLAVFAAAGAVVWAAGTRLSRYVNEISDRTGVGKAFMGALLLGGITSLPEVATTLTASVAGEPALAVNNIFGSIAMNVLLLAVVADVFDGGRALTAQVDQSTLILQGALSVLVIAVAAAAALLSDIAVLGVGVGSAVLFVTAVIAFYLTHRFQDVQRWAPAGGEGQGERREGFGTEPSIQRSLEELQRETQREEETGAEQGRHSRLARAQALRAEAHREMVRAHRRLAEAEAERARAAGEASPERQEDDEHRGSASVQKTRAAQQRVRRLSSARLIGYTVAAALAILVAGYFLSRTGSAIATQTGLGASLVGFILVAFGTSLPEISTMISAVRLGQFSLVFSEIFGTNIFNSTIIFYTDIAYRGGPLLEQVGLFTQTAALLGIVLTAVYLVGLVTRSENTSLFNLGKDSLTVIVLYALGVGVLYWVR